MIPDLGVGGAERMLVNLCTSLDRTRYEVRVVSLYASGGTLIERALAGAGIPVVHLGKRTGFDRRMFTAIARALREWPPAIVHTHRAILQYALPALAASRVPTVHTVHNVALREVPLHGRIAHRLAFRLGVAPVAIGSMVARSFRDAYGRDPAAIVGNGINTVEFEASAEGRHAWRSRESIASDAVVCVSVARFAPQKNVSGLIEAFGRAAAIDPRLVLLLAGDGPDRPSLVERVQRLGLEQRIRFLGNRSDVADVLGASDVFVLASRWEGNPLSVMEAMAAGLPVVSTGVGGVPELVADEETGFLVEPGGTQRFANALLTLSTDSALRARMSAAARVRARETCDARVMAAGYDAVYERVRSRAR